MIMFNANQLCFSELRDYCERETFHAYCSNSKVVLMQEAIYGRMDLGTCLTVDLGFMGCFRWVYAIQLYWRYRIIMNCITTYNHVITIGMAFAVTCYLTWTTIALVEYLVRYQWHGWWFWRILAQTMWGVIYKQVIPVYLVSFYANILCKQKNSPINMLQIQIKKIDAYICGIKRFYDNSIQKEQCLCLHGKCIVLLQNIHVSYNWLQLFSMLGAVAKRLMIEPLWLSEVVIWPAAWHWIRDVAKENAHGSYRLWKESVSIYQSMTLDCVSIRCMETMLWLHFFKK